MLKVDVNGGVSTETLVPTSLVGPRDMQSSQEGTSTEVESDPLMQIWCSLGDQRTVLRWVILKDRKKF